jgi:general stress protein 26
MKNELKKSEKEDLRIIGDIIESAPICMLTTHNHAGGLCSRPMYTLEADASGSVWFFTSTTSHLVSEIRSNHQVQLTYSTGKEKFVSASANAYEVLDREHIKELWSPMMKAWFPEGLDSQDLVLLRVELQDVEYWANASSAVTKVAGLFKALVSNEQYRPGHYEKINLHH